MTSLRGISSSDPSFMDVPTKVIHRFRPNKHHNNKYKRKRYKTWASYIKMMALTHFISFPMDPSRTIPIIPVHLKWWKRLKNYAWLHKNKLLYQDGETGARAQKKKDHCCCQQTAAKTNFWLYAVCYVHAKLIRQFRKFTYFYG